MQRKNNLLRTSQIAKTSKNGMAMMMAIIVLVVIATVMALSMSLTVKTTKRTTDMYLYEQSILLSQSAADYAMLKTSQQNPCSLGNLNYGYGGTGARVAGFAPDDIYTINITMKYMSFAGTSCDSNATANGTRYGLPITHPNSDGSVRMDITVTANPDGTTEPIRYFRRSIQKL